MLLLSSEVSSVLAQESKNLGSANSDEFLQVVAEIPSDFNSLTMVYGDSADIPRTLLLVMFEAIFGAYLLAVLEFDMGTL